MKICLQFNQYNEDALYNKIINDLNSDKQVIKKDVSDGYGFYFLRSEAMIQVVNREVYVYFSENKPHHKRKNLICTLKDLLPKYMKKINFNLLKESSIVGILWTPNKSSINVPSSFISYYNFQFDRNYSKKRISLLGILPIKFDKGFFLTKIGGSLDIHRNVDFNISLKNSQVSSYILIFLFNYFRLQFMNKYMLSLQ